MIDINKKFLRSDHIFILNLSIIFIFFSFYIFSSFKYTDYISISIFEHSVSADIIEYYFYGEYLLNDFNFIIQEFFNYYIADKKTIYILPPLFPLILNFFEYFYNYLIFNILNLIISFFLFISLNIFFLIKKKLFSIVNILIIQILIFNPYLFFNFINFNVDNIFNLLCTFVIILFYKKIIYGDNNIQHLLVFLLSFISILLKSNGLCLFLALIFIYLSINKKISLFYFIFFILFAILYLPYFDRYTTNAITNRMFFGISPNYYLNISYFFINPFNYLSQSLLSFGINLINLLCIYETQSGSYFRYLRYFYSPIILFFIITILIYKKNLVPLILLISFYIPLFFGNPMPRYIIPILLLPILINYFRDEIS